MAYIFKKMVQGRTVWYIGENKRINGVSKRVWQRYIGNSQTIKDKLIGPSEIDVLEYGTIASSLAINDELEFSKIVDGVITKREQGLSYGEWAAKWWQWVYSIPRDENPLYDETRAKCAVKQIGSVWFVVGTFGGSLTRECAIPSNTSLFFPLINTECSIAGGDGKTE